jgi:hypothetical protein
MIISVTSGKDSKENTNLFKSKTIVDMWSFFGFGGTL